MPAQPTTLPADRRLPPPLGERFIRGIESALLRHAGEQGHEPWLIANFPDIAHQPLGERHKRLWQWFADLRPLAQVDRLGRGGKGGESPSGSVPSVPSVVNHPSQDPPTANRQPPTAKPRVEVWPRGGAKSATAELGCAYLATKLTRRFVLYVSGTQSQADTHVQSIASMLEHLGIQRAISKYGASKGWRRNQLRTADGFHVAAYGLDGASRGIKIGRYRPDLIVFDDIDSQADSAAVVRKKIDAITTAILPTGSPDCAILVIQNLIHRDGVVAQLVDGRAAFLHDREVFIEPAVIGLKTEIASAPGADGLSVSSVPSVVHPSNRSHSSYSSHSSDPAANSQPPTANVYRITAGTPTWQGQTIETCERQINDWGLRAFLQEAQHEVENVDGYFFDATKFQIVDDAPNLLRVCLAWDLAATEGGGDHTVAVLMGIAHPGGGSADSVQHVQPVPPGQPGTPNAQRPTPNASFPAPQGVLYVLNVQRVQMSSERIRDLVLRKANLVRNHFHNYAIRFPQDPGQAGKFQADHLRRLLHGFKNVKVLPVTGPKAARARSYAEQVNLGNVRLLRGPWNAEFIEEHRRFREDDSHEFDDQIDAASDAFNELSAPAEAIQTQTISTNPLYARQYATIGPRWQQDEEDDEQGEF